MAVEGPLISESPGCGHRRGIARPRILYAYDDDRVDCALARGRLRRILADWSLTSPASASTTRIVAILNLRLPPPSLIACWTENEGRPRPNDGPDRRRARCARVSVGLFRHSAPPKPYVEVSTEPGTVLANALNSLRASNPCVTGRCCVSCLCWPSPKLPRHEPVKVTYGSPCD